MALIFDFFSLCRGGGDLRVMIDIEVSSALSLIGGVHADARAPA